MTHPLDRAQAAVAAVVTRSHATIPPGFVVVAATVTGALAYARAATRRLRTLVGLPELAVKAIGALRGEFPNLYTGPAAHVGVTIDVGTGLHVPVVRDADRRGLGEIGALLLEYRRTAMLGQFRPGQLEGATIMLALAGEGVLFARPIIHPGQVCAVSLGTPAPEVRRGATADVVHIGLAYDHRAATGQAAARYLTRLAGRLESLVGADDSFD